MRSQVISKYHTALITNACGFGEKFQDTAVLERIWQEGVSSFSYVFFLSVLGDKPLCKHRLQKELSEYHIVCQTWIHMGHLWWLCCASSGMHKTHQSWQQCASIMNAQGVISVCVSICAHMDWKTKHFALLTKFHFVEYISYSMTIFEIIKQ